MSYIEKTLMSEERILYRTQLHKIIFASAVIWWMCALFLLIFGRFYPLLNSIVMYPYGLYHWLSGATFFLGFWALLRAWVAWSTSEYGLTNRRVVAKEGWIRRVIVDVLLSKVESVQIRQSVLGRIFGYGCVIICGTGGSRDPFYRVCNPVVFHQKVQQQIERMQRRGQSDA